MVINSETPVIIISSNSNSIIVVIFLLLFYFYRCSINGPSCDSVHRVLCYKTAKTRVFATKSHTPLNFIILIKISFVPTILYCSERIFDFFSSGTTISYTCAYTCVCVCTAISVEKHISYCAREIRNSEMSAEWTRTPAAAWEKIGPVALSTAGVSAAANN